MVTLGSVEGTIFWYSTPTNLSSPGTRSTGIRSIRFIRKIQTKIVRARGATSGLRPWKVSLTVLSTNSTIISTKLTAPVGTSLLAFSATRRNSQQKKIPSPIDQSMLSTCIAIKPIAEVSAPPCAMVQTPPSDTTVPS